MCLFLGNPITEILSDWPPLTVIIIIVCNVPKDQQNLSTSRLCVVHRVL